MSEDFELNLLDLADLHLLQNINNSPQDLEASNLNFFQLNQQRSEIVDQCTRNLVLRHNELPPTKITSDLPPTGALLLQKGYLLWT